MIKMLQSFIIITLLSVSSLSAQKENNIGIIALSGEYSVPPVSTSATGTGVTILSNDWTELQYSITIEGITPTSAHFHNAAMDANGAIVKTLDFSGGSTISGVWTATDSEPFTAELLNEYLAGRIYVNVPTSTNLVGEIRGNILVSVVFKSTFSGDKSVPVVTSDGFGVGSFILYAIDQEFEYSLNVRDISPTDAHFHGASATATGPIIKDINLNNNGAGGEWFGDDAQPLTDSLITEMIKENIYVNIHTSTVLAGEIRGQLELETALPLGAYIVGSNQVPPNSSIHSGTAIMDLDNSRTTLNYDIVLSIITDEMISEAHIHSAGAGLIGGVVKTLEFTNGRATGTWISDDATEALTESLVDELLSGRFYVDVHTPLFPDGELRGQIQTIQGYAAELGGSQAGVESDASGTMAAMFAYDDSGAYMDYSLTVEGLEITEAHFHAGAAGESGGILKTIEFVGNNAEGEWNSTDSEPLTDDIVDMIRSGGVYVNIHTAANPDGEIRGQLLTNLLQFPISVQDDRILQLPASFELKQNYPNPFNPTTLIEYDLQKSDRILLTIHNLLGQEVARLVDKNQNAGVHSISWDASAMSSGIYFYGLQAGNLSRTRKMVLLK